MEQSGVLTSDEIEVLYEKIGIFEVAKQQDICNNSEAKNPFFWDTVAAFMLFVCKYISQHEVKKHRREDEWQIDDVPPAVEKKAAKDQKSLTRLCESLVIEIKVDE